VLTVVDLLELGRGEVVAGGVESAVVVPVDPLEGGQLDIVEASPGSTPADHLGLEQADLALGERVVERVVDRADAGCRACLGESFGTGNGRVLRPASG
jgi:hypothetical protein